MEYNKIVITTDGVTTKADEYIGKKLVKSALAKCGPDDTFKFNTGAKLAFERLMKPDKPVQDKPTYKAGDKVRISSKGQRPINCFNVGEVVTVGKYESNDYGCTRSVDGRFQWVNENELEPYTEHAKPDKAEMMYCINDFHPGVTLTKGKTYTLCCGKFNYDNHSCYFGGPASEFCANVNSNVGCPTIYPLVKRPAKVGEWVYLVKEPIVNQPDHCSGEYRCDCHSGNIVKITSFGIFASVCSAKGNRISGLRDDEYLVLDGYQPEPDLSDYEWVDGVKGMDATMQCLNGFQYEVGKTYDLGAEEVNGWENTANGKGYHFCKTDESVKLHTNYNRSDCRYFKVRGLVRKGSTGKEE